MVASECGKRYGVLSDEPSRSDIIAVAPFIFLECESSADQHLCAYGSAYGSVFCCGIYCHSFPIVSLISHSVTHFP
jgi:hypothetical protein